MMGQRHFFGKSKLLLGLSALWLVFCILLTPVYTTVKLDFAQDPSGEAIATVFTSLHGPVTARGAKARVITSGTVRISFLDFQYGSHCSFQRIDPVDEYWQQEELLTLRGITVYKNGFPVMKLSGTSLTDYFSGNEQVEIQDSQEGLAFFVRGGDPQLLPTWAFTDLYVKSGRLWSVLSSFLLGGLLLGGFGVLLQRFSLQIRTIENRFTRITCWICFAGILSAVFLCVYVGLRSPFWLNPDEYDTRSAILYYGTHWAPPDIRSEDVGSSYSVYGMSRHFELNTFYFWAGKLGSLFSDPTLQVRAFSLLILGIMAVLILKNIRNYTALSCVLLLTPQVWYLFSYATSDALDLFVGFLCLYQLIRQESLLNRMLAQPFTFRQAPGYLLMAYLFVHVFWSKPSFFTILIFLFLILLIRLFEKQGKERKILFQKYLALAGLTLAIFVVRYLITDYPYYGLEKMQVIAEVTERHAQYSYKPSTPPQLQAPSKGLCSKGVTLGEFFRNYEFNKSLFRTLSGFFGCYAFGAEDWYYVVMGILYLALFVCLVYYFQRMKNRQKWLEFAAVCFTLAVQYALVVFNAYVVDFQPQGRYLFPSLLFVAYLIHTCEPAKSSRVVRGILCATCIMSLYAFVSIGIPNLVPLHTGAIH
ncbi:MAG: DUF2142 domain-containing protein [Lachnospiraceae bacterium]|nr:DUF2142 domain-containing protein [Lachnospiraceae bacterium]